MSGPVTILNFLLGIGTMALMIFAVGLIIARIAKLPLAQIVARHGSILLRILFVMAVLGSLTYDLGFGYAPCLLCWYQRLAIFPITLLSFTADIRKSVLLQTQIIWLSSIGLVFAVFHNYLDIFQPSGIDVCGTTGPSCLIRYVYEFGFITIPLMSAVMLLTGLLIALTVRRYPQKNVVA